MSWQSEKFAEALARRLEAVGVDVLEPVYPLRTMRHRAIEVDNSEIIDSKLIARVARLIEQVAGEEKAVHFVLLPQDRPKRGATLSRERCDNVVLNFERVSIDPDEEFKSWKMAVVSPAMAAVPLSKPWWRRWS